MIPVTLSYVCSHADQELASSVKKINGACLGRLQPNSYNIRNVSLKFGSFEHPMASNELSRSIGGRYFAVIIRVADDFPLLLAT